MISGMNRPTAVRLVDKQQLLLSRLEKIRMRAGMDYEIYYNTITDVMNILDYLYIYEIEEALEDKGKYASFGNESRKGE